MTTKAPVVLVVLVDTRELCWFVGFIGLDGQVVPLLRSETGDLERYRGLDFDEQLAFLRHRFCGVLQRGCDRLWAREKKAQQFVIVFEQDLAEETGQLTPRIAEHFADWMLNPPVAVFRSGSELHAGQSQRLDQLAGDIAPPLKEVFRASLDGLLAAREDAGVWEVAPRKDGGRST
jgi:hypothetical protein